MGPVARPRGVGHKNRNGRAPTRLPGPQDSRKTARKHTKDARSHGHARQDAIANACHRSGSTISIWLAHEPGKGRDAHYGPGNDLACDEPELAWTGAIPTWPPQPITPAGLARGRPCPRFAPLLPRPYPALDCTAAGWLTKLRQLGHLTQLG